MKTRKIANKFCCYLKKATAVLLALLVVLGAGAMGIGKIEWLRAGADSYYDNWGGNIDWQFDIEDELLTISGTGEIKEAEGNESYPWSRYASITYRGKEYHIKRITISDGITSIPSGAFTLGSDCVEITIPDSVKSIGDRAFSGTGITEITLPSGITTISDYLFLFCKSLSAITIPDGVTTIGRSAFDNCVSLNSVNIPDSLTSIGYSAFVGSSLKDITIPASVSDIGEKAFYACRKLTAIHVNSGNTKYCDIDGVLFNRTMTDLLCYPNGNGDIYSDKEYSVPFMVKKIGNYAFYGCKSLIKVTCPTMLTEIGEGAFSLCTSLKSINIPDTVTTIGGFAFSCCDTLDGIVLPDSIQKIETDTFSHCKALSKIIIPSNITEIGGSAFTGCDSLESVEFRDGLEKIGEYAFNGCGCLSEAVFPESLKIIGEGAFEGCSLGSVTVTAGEKYIGWGAFANNDLRIVNIACQTIDGAAFHNNENLTDILLLDGVKKIGKYAFWNTGVTGNFLLPPSVTDIGGFAWEDTAITDIFIPSADVYIDEAAFAKDTYYGKKPPDGFEYLDITIHGLPGSTAEAYANSAGMRFEPIGDDEHPAQYVIFCDDPTLCLKAGQTFNLGIGILSNGVYRTDVDQLTATPQDDKITVNSSKVKDNIKYLSITANKKGDTELLIEDPVSSTANMVYISISEAADYTYTVETVPVLIEKDGCCKNAYYGGLYIDSFKYKKNSDGSYDVSFGAYNSNSMIGAMEVYDKDGVLLRVDQIKKGPSLPKDLISTLEAGATLVRDLFDKDGYKDEGYTTLTPFNNVNIPKGGYMRITFDMENSYACFMLNGVDLFFQMAKHIGSFEKDMQNASPEQQYKIIEKIKEATLQKCISNALSESVKSSMKSFSKKLSLSTTTEILSAENYDKTFKELAGILDEIGIQSMLKDAVVSVLKKGAEKVVVNTAVATFGLEPIYLAYKTGFKILGLSETLGQLICCAQGVNTIGITIQAPDRSSRIMDSVRLETSFVFDDSAVLRAFEIAEQRAEKQKELYEQIQNDMEEFDRIHAKKSDWEKARIYQIELMLNGEKIQPEGDIDVYLKIPHELTPYNNLLKVYRVELDNSLTDMNAVIAGSEIKFTTNHFSEYIIMPDTTELEGIIMNSNTLTLLEGKSEAITLLTAPDNAVLEWSSSDRNIVDTDRNGNITAISSGTADIKVIAGQDSAVCKVTVLKKMTLTVVFSGSIVNNSKAEMLIKSSDGNFSELNIDRTTPEGGNLTFGLENGTYELTVSKPGHTSYIDSNFTVPTDALPETITLYPGDINGDGRILAHDHAAMTEVFGFSSSDSGYNAAADFNEDGYINSKDRADIVTNFGKTSTVIE